MSAHADVTSGSHSDIATYLTPSGLPQQQTFSDHSDMSVWSFSDHSDMSVWFQKLQWQVAFVPFGITTSASGNFAGIAELGRYGTMPGLAAGSTRRVRCYNYSRTNI